MRPASTPETIVVADANVLINLAITRRLGWLHRLPGLAFQLPEEVREEISAPLHRRSLDAHIRAGHLTLLRVTDVADLARAAEHGRRMGSGEAMCLALAERRGLWLACDERRVVRRIAVSVIGAERILTTVDIYRRAIVAGLVTIDDADADRALLARRKFVMAIVSFRGTR